MGICAKLIGWLVYIKADLLRSEISIQVLNGAEVHLAHLRNHRTYFCCGVRLKMPFIYFSITKQCRLRREEPINTVR